MNGLSTPVARFYSPRARTYDGTQLRSHFALREFGIVGDSIVAFIGPCRVPLSRMVDLVDVRERSPIRAASMVHLIAEHFDESLEAAVLRQHVLAAIVAEEARQSASKRADVRRRGNDLFIGRRKLSVSVATRSPVSTLVHVGINIDPRGAPVPAVGLRELGIEPEALAHRLLDRYAEECAIAARSRAKVRPVT